MSSLYFLETHKLGAELGSFPPFLVREAVRLHDSRTKVVKIYSKMGQTPEEQHQIHSETQFWSLVRHPRVIEIEHVYDEEGFIYIVYEYPQGGDLAALIIEESRTFTEGFAKKIASALLDALIFLHGNGILHGAVSPTNVIFTSPATVPGWADQCKLSFFRVDNARSTTVFQDIQDLAFTIVSVMRRTPGLLSRKFFTPDLLQKKEWSHVTDDFVDFIEQLWYCEEKYRMAETFKSHPWVASAAAATDATETPAQLLRKSVREDETIEGPLLFKMREKKGGRRQWHKRWGVIRRGMLLMYMTSDEDSVDNQDLCQAINLKNKSIFVYTMGRHNYMIGLQDMVLQQTVVWLRFETEIDYNKWKAFLTSRYEREQEELDPNSDANRMTSVVAPKSSNLAAILASNLANNIVAAQYRQDVPPPGPGGTKESEDVMSRSHAEALVQAVDDVSREFSRQIEVQASGYVRKSKLLQNLRGNKITNGRTGASFHHSLSPYPSEQKCRVHPSIKWDMRAEELMLVQATGTPVNKPIREGEQWFIVDATWFKHWVSFVASTRRRAPPGPIDNLWMINPLTELPYEHMIEDVDDINGDFRRLPPQIWELFETWYGGGPAISVTGPPTEDTRRWVVHVEELPKIDDGTESNVVDLMGKLDHPEDIIEVGEEKEEKHLVVDLHKGTRRPSIAEMTLLSKVGGFHDGGHDKISSGMDIIESESSGEESDDDMEDVASKGTSGSGTQYPPLTVDALAILHQEDGADSEEEKEEVKSEEVTLILEKTAVHEDKPVESTPRSEPKKKRMSIFGRDQSNAV